LTDAPIIIDAGPSLNFFATDNERILFRVVQKNLHAPETVRSEVFAKSRSDGRFSKAGGVWMKVEPNLIEILSDTPTAALNAAAVSVIGSPLAQRQRQAKDLGEVMVVIHAVSLANTGRNVGVIIDDGGGRALANAQRARLDRLRQQGKTVGTIDVYNTERILEMAAGTKELPDRAAMRKIYEQLRSRDDGLRPIKQTRLLGPATW